MAHSKKGASQCERWANCLGSNDLIAQLPLTVQNATSEYAAEGTLAHELASKILMRQNWSADDYPEEMYEHVMLYTDFVYEIVEKYGLDDSNLWIEKKVSIDDELWGTADCIIVVPYHKLIVIDFKYGAGMKVEVAGNKQLNFYALAAWLTIPEWLTKELPVIEKVIVQPRIPYGDPISSETITEQELLEFGAWLKEKSAEVQPGAPLHAGEWCQKSFCPARSVCPAYQAYNVELVKADFCDVEVEPQLPSVLNLSDSQVVGILDRLPMLEDWIREFRSYAFNRLETQGEESELGKHYKLVNKRTKRKYLNVEEAEKATEFLGDTRYRRDLKPLTEIEKEIKKFKKNGGEVPEDFSFSDYLYTPEAGKTMVKISDSRQGQPISAISDFKEDVIHG